MEIFETPLFDDDFYKMLARFMFNCVFVLLIVFVAFYPNQRKKNYVFINLMMNITVFFICFTFKKLDMSVGMALGLFAIFAILRYRTDAIRIKEMTYLFVVVGIAVVNALSNKKTSYAELVFVNMAIFASAWLLERFLFGVRMRNQQVIYDNLELMKPENHEQFIADLSVRTGLGVCKAEVKKIDFSKGVGMVVVFYEDDD